MSGYTSEGRRVVRCLSSYVSRDTLMEQDFPDEPRRARKEVIVACGAPTGPE